jgi:RNase adapter protein RapZ
MSTPVQLILISGMSGSGKSVALNALEDAGYYCVDNLPASLLPATTEFLRDQGYGRIAVSIDVRSGEGLAELPLNVSHLKRSGVDLRLIFLDAKTDTLTRRFSETRRRHPLSDGKLTITECIARERELLATIGELGARLDTSDLSANALRAWIRDFLGIERGKLTLVFQSFGFKHGIPLDADQVFDVRCLPNPHYDPALRDLTGKDQAVIEFLEREPDVKRMAADIQKFVGDWLPNFERDNRSYLNVAIGCTGGRHRSVYLAEGLARHFKGSAQILLRHRELAS